MRAAADLPDLTFEQPCETLEQCAHVRTRNFQPISIDERAESIADILRIVREGAGDIINIKINRVGGLTKARTIRDIALNAGIQMLVMESGGAAGGGYPVRGKNRLRDHRLAQAFTGRDKILKFEGAYHGNHDYAMISAFPKVAGNWPQGVAEQEWFAAALDEACRNIGGGVN